MLLDWKDVQPFVAHVPTAKLLVPLQRLRRLTDRSRALGDDAAQHQPIEVFAQRRGAIAGERRADPPGLHGIPGGLQIALRPRGRREPVQRRAVAGANGDLLFHSCADAVVDVLAIDVRTRTRVAVERIGPPVDDALAAAGGLKIAAVEDGIEDVRGGAVRAVQIQRLAEPADVLGALARREPLRIETRQSIARVGQIVGRDAQPKPFEVRARRDEIRRVGALRYQPRLLCCVDRRFVLPLVVQLTGFRERIVRGARE